MLFIWWYSRVKKRLREIQTESDSATFANIPACGVLTKNLTFELFEVFFFVSFWCAFD